MKWSWFFLGFLMFVFTTEGSTFVVDPLGEGDFKTISQAILIADDGDTILVKPGEYEGILLDRTLRIIGLTAKGAVIINGHDGNALRINAPGCVAENLSLIGAGKSEVLFVESSGNLIGHCDLKGSIGISVKGVNNTFEECHLDSEVGMELASSRCNIINSTFRGNKGISIKNGSLNEVNGCSFHTGTGIEIISSTENTLSSNSLTGQFFGITLSQSSGNWIENNNISGQYLSGIDLLVSDGNNLSKNYINNCKLGISLRESDNNSLSDNLCKNNERAGIYSNNSRSNMFLENELIGNGNGILLTNSVINLLNSNKVHSNNYGISLRGSIQNFLRNNSMNKNHFNLRIDSGEISSAPLALSSFDFYIQDIDRSNLADGKPICYLINKSDLNVTNDYGFVGLIGCSNVSIQNQNISNSTAGILIVNSIGCAIRASNISHSEEGIAIMRSSNWIVNGSLADGCKIGFMATDSKNGQFFNDTALGSEEVGFKLLDSLNLSLTSSDTYMSGKGISLVNCRLCSLINCTANQNKDDGIALINSHKCLIAENKMQQNSRGLALFGSNACQILNNSLKENKLDGIVLEQLSSAELRGNSALNNSQGVFVQSSQKAKIEGNNLNQNIRYGLRMSFSSLCEIKENNFIRNEISGVNLVDCKDNLLYHNIFVENGYQNALDNGINQWNAGPKLGGNYWSDHEVSGNPGNSIKEIRTQGIDKYPFQDPGGWK
ncbi:MAG: right-handed parallel beta-helix repeat-containing protein [Methanotrichaceae archaeon]|nr:right-handed parallel beta-helix repeat-containing protein [Methanotrichaceae archaeon]